MQAVLHNNNNTQTNNNQRNNTKQNNKQPNNKQNHNYYKTKKHYNFLCSAFTGIKNFTLLLFLTLFVSVQSNANVQQDNPQSHIAAYADDLRLMSYNVYFMPEFYEPFAHALRAKKMLQGNIFANQDVVILVELFEKKPSEILLQGLKADYPYQTPILGKTKKGWSDTQGSYSWLNLQNGGVAIASRWPIEEKIQFVFKKACGTDGLSDKGFVYVRINKNGKPYHVIGTHIQSDDSMCLFVSPQDVRKHQFQQLQDFIKQKNIPADEVVFIGGDFNVVKESAEYPAMLKLLEVSEPQGYAGFRSTWDPFANSIAHVQFPDWHRSEYLDYIFVSKNHAQPSFWHNQVLDVTTSPWQWHGKTHYELSDHLPVQAFAYADTHTPTHSYRWTNNPYQKVTLTHGKTGKQLFVNYKNQLTKLVLSDSKYSFFSVNAHHPVAQTSCVFDGALVQIREASNNRLYIADDKSLLAENPHTDTSLRIKRIASTQSTGEQPYCIEDGDMVKLMFVDVDDATKAGKYLTHKDGDMVLVDANTMTIDSEDALFTISMPKGQTQSWKHLLRYK